MNILSQTILFKFLHLRAFEWNIFDFPWSRLFRTCLQTLANQMNWKFWMHQIKNFL